MIPMAERWTAGVAKAIAEVELPWHVTRLGCRAEYMLIPNTKVRWRAALVGGLTSGILFHLNNLM